MKKLAIISTHPIQYNAPMFRLLAQRGVVQPRVFYTWEQSAAGAVYDPGFGKVRSWDIPLLDGYDHVFVKNTAERPGSDHFKGVINPTLISDLAAWQPDAILVYGWSFKSHLDVMRHFKGKVPVWFRGDSTLLDEAPGLSVKKMLRRTMLTWIYRNIDRAFYVGEANKQYYRKHGLKEQQLVFAPHAIDNDRFADLDGSQETAARQLRESLRIEPQDFVFLFAGKLEPKKDPELLLRAFTELSLPHTHLVFAGNGVLEEKLRAAVAGKGFWNVHFIGFQNQTQMPAVYRMADVFVLPSAGPGETWGLAINEAMASGRAFIVSDKCGCAVNLVQESSGFLFPAGNLDALKKNLNKAASLQREKIKAMGAAGQQQIRNYSFAAVAKVLEDTLQQS